MQNEVIQFLIRAKKNTYAGNGAQVAPSRPGSHDLCYEEGSLQYRDTYLGGRLFAGEEALWKSGTPFWAMNYCGRITGEHFSGDFLKLALRNVPATAPYRGPELFRDGGYEYRCMSDGCLEWFQGHEEIRYQGETIYECNFHGGTVE